MSAAFTVPLFLRGEVITDDLVSFGTRGGGSEFQGPDMSKYVERLPLARTYPLDEALKAEYEAGRHRDPQSASDS